MISLLFFPHNIFGKGLKNSFLHLHLINYFLILIIDSFVLFWFVYLFFPSDFLLLFVLGALIYSSLEG